jgi:hypothetical protein
MASEESIGTAEAVSHILQAAQWAAAMSRRKSLFRKRALHAQLDSELRLHTDNLLNGQHLCVEELVLRQSTDCSVLQFQNSAEIA